MIANRGRNGIVFIHAAFGFFLVIFIVGIIITNFIIDQENKLSEKIYPGIYIDHYNAAYKTKAEVELHVDQPYAKLPKFTLTVLYKDSPVATLDAQTLDLHSNTKDIVEKAYLVGRSSNLSSRIVQKIKTLFKLDTFEFTTSISYSQNSLKNFLSSIGEQYNIPAKNALFTFENGRVTNFREEENGLKIDSDKFYRDAESILKNLKKDSQSKTLVLNDIVVQPEITLSKANSFNIQEQIGEGKSDYSHSSSDRIHNVILATSKFNGILIPKDAVFSFDDAIGDISTTSGYKPAYIIKDGKTVLGDGGGVCQVSTTFFRAALNTGLPIIERHAHAYRVLYYENDSKPGIDATIFSPTVDLKVKNDTGGAILIQTEVDEEKNLLYFRFYGKKDNRKVEISPVTVSNEQPPPPALYQDDFTLKKGVVKQVDFPAWGAKAVFSYKVTLNNQVTQDQTFVSQYRPWQAVYLVGQQD